MNNAFFIAPRIQRAGLRRGTRQHIQPLTGIAFSTRTFSWTCSSPLWRQTTRQTSRRSDTRCLEVPTRSPERTATARCFSVRSNAQARQRGLTKAVPKTGVQHRTGPTPDPTLTWQDYDPEGGLPLSSGDVSQTKITEVFGSGVGAQAGNWILRLMNYRRQSGSLIDLGIDFPEETQVSKEMAFKALGYLRDIQPDFNENEAGAAWADMEAQKLEAEYIERAEGVGLYQKTEQEAEKKAPDVYGDSSVLVAVRKAGEARYKAEQKEKESLEKEREERSMREYGLKPKEQATADNSKSEVDTPSEQGQPTQEHEDTTQRDVVLQGPTQKAWLQPVERKPWVKYYEEQAMLVKENIVPQMSYIRRVGPSALVALAVLGICAYLHENYVPPSRSARIFPDLPPSLATIGAIVAANLVIALAFRMPPLWRTMNKWFISVPALPVPTGVLTSMFTHQSFAHLTVNMVLLWAFGRYLHEDIGRGTFLAIYFGSGVSAGLFSLGLKVFRQQWLTYVCGSSTAVYGIIAATCLLRSNSQVQMFGQDVPMTGLILLGGFIALELFGALRSPLRNKVDFTGHFGGLASGIVAALLIRREAAARQMTRSKPSETDMAEASRGDGL